ncbi:hypothetical protein, partial [Bdellovibrio sp.]|uniref:hypothetical protein n=1 Tax=Bdellovibrio sp. TaxID=28201 RepID=UPI0039E229BA
NSATQQLSNSATQQLSNSSHNCALNTKKQKIFLYILVTLGLSACSLDAQIINGRSLNPEFEIQERKEPDFIYGEVVTTYGGKPGYEVKAVFGEISEKTKSLNGNQWQLEGVFYE